MAAFTVRVELHGNPTWDDYIALHAAMEAEGFSRTIKDVESGVEYHLPMAEYNIYGEFSRGEVGEKAKRAIKRTSKSYSLLVTESLGRSWWELEPVEAN